MLRAALKSCAQALLFLAAAVALTVGGGELAAVPLKPPMKDPKDKDDKLAKENKNTLIAAHRDKLVLACSSAFGGWPVERLIDGDPAKSWFSASNDSAAKGTKPWVEVTFPEDVKVRRVTVLGNREPPYEKNYNVLAGTIELRDKDGKVLWSESAKGAGDAYDFEFKPKGAVDKVRTVRFWSLEDEGAKNGFGDIALGEIQIE
jgi:hypothetical protein